MQGISLYTNSTKYQRKSCSFCDHNMTPSKVTHTTHNMDYLWKLEASSSKRPKAVPSFWAQPSSSLYFHTLVSSRGRSFHHRHHALTLTNSHLTLTLTHIHPSTQCDSLYSNTVNRSDGWCRFTMTSFRTKPWMMVKPSFFSCLSWRVFWFVENRSVIGWEARELWEVERNVFDFEAAALAGTCWWCVCDIL